MGLDFSATGHTLIFVKKVLRLMIPPLGEQDTPGAAARGRGSRMRRWMERLQTQVVSPDLLHENVRMVVTADEKKNHTRKQTSESHTSPEGIQQKCEIRYREKRYAESTGR